MTKNYVGLLTKYYCTRSNNKDYKSKCSSEGCWNCCKSWQITNNRALP